MKALFLALLSLLSFIGAFANFPFEETPGEVLKLNERNYPYVIREYDQALIRTSGYYYSNEPNNNPKYSSEFKEAARQLALSFPEYKCLEVSNVWDQIEPALFGNSRNYITKLLENGKSTLYYQGSLSSSDIVDWMEGLHSFGEQVDTLEETVATILGNDITGVFFGDANSDAYRRMLNAILIVGDIPLIHTNNQTVRNSFSVNEGQFVLFDSQEKMKDYYSGSFYDDSATYYFNEFIKSSVSSNRMILRSGWRVNYDILTKGYDLVFLLRGDDEAGYQAEKAFRTAVEDFRGKMLLRVFIDQGALENWNNDELSNMFSQEQLELPAIRVVKPSQGNLKYAFKDSFDAVNIHEFVNGVLNGTVNPYY